MKSSNKGKIFINYRRSDSLATARHLVDTLTDYFGEGRIFRDVEGIAGGQKFGDEINNTMGSADAVIVLIGEEWLNTTDSEGQRRLDNSGDWVATEIAAALKKKLPVFPVLIENTPMPRGEDLPDKLKPLVQHNAITITDQRWDYDVKRLAQVISLDIPGTAAERQLTIIRTLVSWSLFLAVMLPATIVAWNLIGLPKLVVDENGEQKKSVTQHDGFIRIRLDPGDANVDIKTPIEYWQSGTAFVFIIFASAALLWSVRLVHESKQKFIYAAIIIGMGGTLIFYVSIWLWDDWPEPFSNFFGSTLIATAMLALLNTSGFKPK